MFLDQALIVTGQSVDLDSKESIIETIQEMVKITFTKISEWCPPGQKIEVAEAAFKRADMQWRSAVNKLKEEDIEFVKIDAFRSICESKPEFSTLAKRIWK